MRAVADASAGTARRFASALARLDAETLEPALVEKARLCLFDFLASAFTARDLPWARQALSAVSTSDAREGEGERASIIATPRRAAPGDAAFANAVRGHGLVRDDMHLGSVSHLGAVVIPPALALAQTRSLSGRALIAAVITGYEAGAKLGRAILDVDVSRIFRPTGITGPFAGAAAGSRVLGLSEAECATALALAANTAAGYNEWAATGGSEMFFHAGFAARNAVTCVALAAAGADASATALEGAAGILAAFGKNGSEFAVPFDGRPEILDVFFKEVPACNFAQASAQAARALAVSADLDPAAIDTVRARVPYASAAYPGCDAPGPFTRSLQAKMSIHYNVASALVSRDFDERNYDPSSQPTITDLARRVTLEVDDALTRAFPARQGAEILVRIRGGKELSLAVDDVAPASSTLVRERFAAAAADALGSARAEELRECIERIEHADDAGELARLSQSTRG